MFEELGAHIPFHHSPHGMALVVGKVGAARLQQDEQEHDQACLKDFTRGQGEVALQHIFGDVARSQREQQGDAGNGACAEQVRAEKAQIGPVE